MRFFKLKYLVYIILSMLLCLRVVCASDVTAPSRYIGLSAEEVDWLEDHPIIEIGVMEDWPPMDFLDAEGEPVGVGANFIKALNVRLGNRLVLKPGRWEEIYGKVMNRELDGLIGITPRKEREKYFLFTDPYIVIPHLTVTRKNEKQGITLEELAGKNLAIEKGFFAGKVIAEKYPQIILQEHFSTSEALNAVSTGMADAYVGNKAVTQYIMRQNFLNNIGFSGKKAETSSINAIGIRKDWPILQDIIQKAMDDVSASERLDLFREWVKPEIIDNTASSQGEMISPSETQPKSMTDTHIALRFIVFAVMFGVACVIIYRNMEKRPLASLLSGVTSVVGRRWIVTFNIVFISIVLTLGAWVLEVVEQNEKQDTKERLETIIRGTTEAMNLWVQQKIRTTVNVARDQDLIRMSELLLEQKKLGYQSDLTLYTFYYENLHKRLILQSSGEGYNIIAPDYSVLLSSYEELIGTRSRAATHQPEILARAFDGEAVVIPAFPSASYHAEHSKVTGLKDGPVMFIAAPIKKGDEVIAVLALYEDPQKGFSRINQLGRSGYSGETYSFDRDGRMMTRSRFLAQLHQDGTIPANEQEIYSLVLRDPRYRLESEVHPVDRKRAYTKAVREALEGRNGADLDGYYNYLGEEVFGAWIWSDKLNLGFVTEIQKVEAMTSYRNVRILILVILSLISLASIAGTSLLLYFAVRSNKNLEQARRYLEKRVKERTENLELAKSEIEQAEARLSAILDNMTEAVVIISDRGVIQRFSIIAETMFGYRADEVIGHNVSILMPPATANAHDGYLENYRHSGKPQVMGYVREVIAKRRNNSEFLAELSVTELKLKNERIFIGVIRDITRRKEMEQEILFAKDKAEAASEAKTAFLATMSHELKTPLNAIICYSEMLEEEAEEIEQSDVFIPDLKRIHASGQHLLHMINEILNLSKLDAGQEKLHVESFDIRQMIRSVEDDMSPMHEKNGNTFLLNFGADLTTTTADLVKSRQILLNLLSNATKFTQNGVVTLTVSLVVEQGKKFVSYKVADTGIGMSEEQQKKVFDPFVQAEETTTRKYGGTGLGLPIVKRYCEMMGGSVSVESEEGKGASFTVLLPDEIK